VSTKDFHVSNLIPVADKLKQLCRYFVATDNISS